VFTPTADAHPGAFVPIAMVMCLVAAPLAAQASKSRRVVELKEATTLVVTSSPLMPPSSDNPQKRVIRVKAGTLLVLEQESGNQRLLRLNVDDAGWASSDDKMDVHVLGEERKPWKLGSRDFSGYDSRWSVGLGQKPVVTNPGQLPGFTDFDLKSLCN
jgi:hypothetical protein